MAAWNGGLERGCDRGLGNEAEDRRANRDTERRAGQIEGEPVQDALDGSRRSPAFLRDALHPVAIDGHERELGRHEESRREDQEQDGE